MNAGIANYLEFTDSESAQTIVGIRSSGIWHSLTSDMAIRPLINWQIANLLGPVVAPNEDEALIVNCISNFEQDELMRLARIVCCLIQAPAILKITDGKILSTIAEFSETTEIVDIINRQPLPIFEPVAKTTYITTQLLDHLTPKILGFIIGLLPEGYAPRLYLKCPKDTLPLAVLLDNQPEDRNALFFLSGIACQLVVKDMRAKNVES